MKLITLTTDFGTADGFVASMKGVLLRLCPEAKIVDITHEIPPQDVVRAAYVLEQSTRWFPRGTIHVVVVDPGVGTERNILIAELGNQTYIAPDNGVLTRVVRGTGPARFRIVTEPRFMLDPVSQTFHGRDIFTPVAAHVANKVPPKRFGPPVERIKLLDLPEPVVKPGPRIAGEVIYTDRFGNLMSNIDQTLLAGTFGPRAAVVVRIGDKTVRGLATTYSSGVAGDVIALINSARLLEIAVNGAKATRTLNLGVGEPVVVEADSGEPLHE